MPTTVLNCVTCQVEERSKSRCALLLLKLPHFLDDTMHLIGQFPAYEVTPNSLVVEFLNFELLSHEASHR